MTTAYTYTALSEDSDVKTGTLDAASEKDVALALQKLNYLPLQIAPATRRTVIWSTRVSIISRPRLRALDLVALTRELEALLNAGVELEPAIELALSSSSGTRARVLADILGDVREGRAFGDALERHPRDFPASYSALVRAGEVSGALPSVLQDLASMLEETQRVRSELSGALIYPAFVCVAAALSLGVMLTAVVPNLAPLFEDAGAQLPAATRLTVSFAAFARENFLVLLAVPALLGMIAWLQYRRPPGRLLIDRLLLKVPLLGQLFRHIDTARFSSTMATLLTGGMPVARSLELARHAISNQDLAIRVDAFVKDARSGVPLSTIFASQTAFPDSAVRLWQVGEKTGRLGQMFRYSGRMEERRAREMTKRLLALLPPTLTIALSGMTGFVLYSMLTAIYSVNEVIK